MLDLRIIRVSSFIRGDTHGVLDLDESRSALRDILTQDAHGEYDVLLDVRDSEIQLSHQDVLTLVEDLKAHAPRFRKRMAILDDWDETFIRMQFMQGASELEGFQVKAFIDFENAVNWLLAGRTTYLR